MSKKPLRRGDVIRIEWCDVFEDFSGDPDRARLARRSSVGIFWYSGLDSGIPVLVTTTTLDNDGLENQNGYCVYPRHLVLNIEVLERAKKA